MCFSGVVDGVVCVVLAFLFFQAEDGMRDLVRSRGLGDVYKRQGELRPLRLQEAGGRASLDLQGMNQIAGGDRDAQPVSYTQLTLPTSDLVEISVVAVSLKKKTHRTQAMT